jgi:hypothetical protein
LKTWYTDDKLENLLFRNSPVAKKIKKVRIGGKEFALAMFYGRGGAVSADYVVAIENNTATGTARNAELKVTPGKIHSVFTFNQLEMLATKDTKGAYIQAAVDKMFAALESLRKTFAATLYGSGYGEVGKVYSAVANASLATAIAAAATPATFTAVAATNLAILVQVHTSMKVDLGSVLNFQAAQASSIPGAVGLLADTLTSAAAGVTGLAEFTVTTIGSPIVSGGNQYVVLGGTLKTAPSATWTAFTATSLACLKGSRTAATSGPSMPTGLAGWIPGYGTRSSASWLTYIGTSFYGTDRSASVDRLAGSYTQKSTQPNTKYYEALLDAVKLARRNGGTPDMIVVNDNDYGKILAEIGASTTLYQAINGSAGKLGVTRGGSDMAYQFSSTYLNSVIDDPYCPEGNAWVLDSSQFSFIGLSNANTPLDDGVQGNNPGVQSVTDVSAPEMNYKFIIDDYINVVPGAQTADGPAALVSMSLYGNFVCKNPAVNVYVDFAN